MKKTQVIAVLMGVMLFGCAHTATEKNLDNKVAGETQVQSRADLGTEWVQLVNTAPNLSEEQKTGLKSLRISVMNQNQELITESLKLRSVLIKDLLAPDYNKAEVSMIKNKLQTVENQRLNVVFNAIDSANKLLGRQAAVHERMINGMFDARGASAD